MKKKSVTPKHTNLAKKSVTLVAIEKGSKTRTMKAWKEDKSITETELQHLGARPAINLLEIWPTHEGYFLTMKFRTAVLLPAWELYAFPGKTRKGTHFFLCVRRVRDTPRTFKDLNRLKKFIEATMPEVKHYLVHQNPTTALTALMNRFDKTAPKPKPSPKKKTKTAAKKKA